MSTADPLTEAGPEPEAGVERLLAAVVLRQMRWWDVVEVARLERECFLAEPWSAETFLSELALDSRAYVVAHDSRGAFVGYLGCALVGPDAEVQTIAVAPRARGAGLGRQLVEHALEVTRSRGARRLHLEVRADNGDAIRLYRRAGFVEQGRRRGYYRAADPAAPAVDALLMQAQLVQARRGTMP